MSFGKRTWITIVALCIYRALSPEPQLTPTNHYNLAVDKPGVQVRIGGYLREEYIAAIGINTLLQNELEDQFTLFKHKGDLDILCSFGREPKDEPVMECFNKLTSFLYWRAEKVYYPPLPTAPIAYTSSPLSKTDRDINFGRHDHDFKTPLFFLGESWLQLNTKNMNAQGKYPFDTLKVGFFSYQVGRGITLGFSSEGGAEYLGWKRENPSLTAPLYNPGFVIRGNLYEGADYEFYFSKWRKTQGNPWQENGNLSYYRTDTQNLSRWGQDLDTNIYASRLLLKKKTTDGISLYAEPYVTYFYEKNHTIELTADSRVHLGSYGMMFESSYGGAKLNIECAGQWGRIKVHPIDRNDIVLGKRVPPDTDTTSVFALFNKIGLSTLDADNNPTSVDSGIVLATDSLLQHIDIDGNRGTSTNGEPLVDSTGALLPLIGSSGKNATNFSNRSRGSFDLELSGFMGVADLEYRLKKLPVKWALAAGYFSGDEYPLNTETNKNYQGFLPLRDFKYQGHMVKSLFALALRWFPRPSNPAYEKLFTAQNNTNATTAMALVGGSFTVMPTGDEKKLSINNNISLFFTTNTLYKWDVNGTIDDPVLEARRQATATALNFQGWFSKEKASPFLGTEMNSIISYWLNENCELLTRVALLIPGRLFADIAGQPNEVTVATDVTNTQKAFGLGQDTCWGINLRFNYYF